MYLAMDGYTKLKLLPKIAKSFQVDPTSQAHSSSIMMEFANQIAGKLISEMKLGRYEIDIESPDNLNHKIVPISKEKYRQYILIFNLKERRGEQYLGRLYLVLLLENFKTFSNCGNVPSSLCISIDSQSTLKDSREVKNHQS